MAGSATVAGAQEVGPANGSLVVVGGALRDLAILEEFVELAGGPDAPIVVIPTAGGRDEYDQYCPCLRQLREVGATNLTVLHTKDRGEANSDEFVAVIGGSSAGATIQGSYLARGDTETNTIMMGDHEEGLGFLRDVTIDQHLLKRNRQFDLIEVIEAHPELLGIGLDENTAIVVRGDSFRVIGESWWRVLLPRSG